MMFHCMNGVVVMISATYLLGHLIALNSNLPQDSPHNLARPGLGQLRGPVDVVWGRKGTHNAPHLRTN